MSDESFESVLNNFVDGVEGAKAVALGRAGEHIRGEAVSLAPILDGDLRGSAGVTVSGDEAHVTFQSVYARAQHYGLDFNHPQGGQALYLEQPMITEAAKVNQIIADTIREAS